MQGSTEMESKSHASFIVLTTIIQRVFSLYLTNFDFLVDVQKGLAVGVTDMEAYGKALRMFHKKHECLVDPWPEEVVYSMNQSISPSADISVAVGMFAGELRT
ncbi:hypothetical protein EDD85DRAFT_955197 [Armillaria nabsnona]|nr:hypothetical protein EDD85DRAFT_955197 [Armillaria nabsnona]